MFNYEGKDQDYMNFAEYMRTLGKMPSQEYTNAYMSQMNPEAIGEANMESEQPQNDSWGGFRGFTAGGAGVLQGQAQLGNLAGFGDGSTANYMGEVMQRNARKKEYTIADMFPFASDYWTSGEGAAYDIGNMLGSSVVLGGETALAAATGGAALGALGVGNAAAAAATAAGGSATAARAAFMTKAITGGMGRAAAKMGMPKLGKALEGPMGTLYALNILKTPLEASSEAGNAGAEALANGASLSDAQRQALIVGGLQMPLLALSNTIESSGLGGLFLKEAEKAGGKKVGKEGLLAILGNITREGVNNAWEEGMQQSTHEYAQGKQNLLGVVNPFQWSDEALQQAAVGGVGGLAIGGGNAAMRAFGTRGGDEAATPQAQEAAEAQENTTMPETPAQEETVAEPIAPTTPAESAADYLDTISQQDENLSMEQRRGIWDVLDSGNEQAIVDVATQFGWQPPVEQAAPAPVTPATTTEQQIQTAVDNVNAATANVANGGEVVEPAAVRPPMPVVESISGGGKVEYPTNPPTFGVAENPVDQNGVKVWLNSVSRAAHEKLSKGNKTRKYLDSDGNINTMALRVSPALRRFIDGNPNAVENLKAALSGNKEAMAWFSKLSPTRQAALVDVLNHGVENWQVTDGDRRSFALYDLRQQLYQKAKNLKGKAKTKLYASLKNSDNNELIKIAKENGLAIPDMVYGKSEPNAPIATPIQPVPDNTTEPIAEPTTNAPIEEPAIEPNTGGGDVTSAINAIINGNNSNAATSASPTTSTDTNGATPAPNKRLAPISIGGVQTMPQESSDGTKLAFHLPEDALLTKQVVDDMKAAGFFYNSQLKAITADNTETAQNFLKQYAVKDNSDIDNGGKKNETDKNGTGDKGGGQGSENPVQNKQPQEPVKAKTGDDQGEGENGETGEVDAPKSEPEKITDENGVTPIPHDAKPDAVKKLQQANTEIIMGKVKAIKKQYEDGELDANAARKAISAFFQKYSQSKAVNKAYSAGTDEKINSIKKSITAKEAEKKRAAAANAASADKQAKEEAKQKKKKLYQDTLNEFNEKANAILSKHKEQELSDVDAIAELDKITKELEERLATNDDKLLVKDKKSFYDDRVKTVKKQQAEIDKAIVEAATSEAIAESSESLTPEGLKAYEWVKQQLSADAKKRYSEKGIDAVAALIAFRAQTWSKLYNKYAKTNFTPLTFAQRYKFVLHDGKIPKFEESGGVTHTITELGDKQSYIDMSASSDEGVLFHELGHVFFADFVAVAESPDAPAQLKKDLATLREWIGDGRRSKEELKKPYRQSAQAVGRWKDEERFSQALVKHVYAGDTPIPWLNKMFAELKSILETYIKGIQYRINQALASPEKTKKTEAYARAYRTDFEIPAEIKRIINETIYYKEADAITFDDKMQVIKALNNELDATFNEEQPPDTKRFNELKQRIVSVGKGGKEYSSEQNAVLEAASKACQAKAELGLLEQKARIAYNEVEEGKVSAVNVESAASGLLEGDPMEFETIPQEACDLLLKGLDEQQRDDVVDLDVEDKVARAVVTDYAVEGKLDDEFEQLCDDLKDYGVEEGIKSVEKYADYVLCMLHKYAAIYNKQKKLEEAEKAYEDAVAALKKAEAEKKLKELVDKKGEDSNIVSSPFDYLPEKTKESNRYANKDKDIQVSSINLNYKKQLEDAFARNATDGEITYIMNQHQKELASYLKDKDEKQKERAKLRAAEIRSLRKKLHAKEIESFALSGAVVRLDKDGKEVVEKIDNGLPNRTYENKRHENEDFKNASASAKLGAAIKREKPKTMLQSAKDWLKEAKDNFYKQWVDKYDALRIFDKAIEDKNGKPVRADQTVLGKMQMVANYASGAAKAIIEGDKDSLKPVIDKYHIKNTVSLKDMMEKLTADCKAGRFKDYVKSANLDGDTSIQGYINALENYLTALTLWESSQNHKLDYDREVAEWQNKGARGKQPKLEEYKFPNNMTEDEIKDIIRSAPKAFRQYQEIFKGFTDNLLDIMLNSGLITADRYDTLKTRYKFYCPLMRDFSDTAAVDDFISQINSGKGLGNVSDPLKSRSSGGSVRDVISPLTTAVKTASAICMKAERNRVGQYMVRQAKKHRLDEFVHEVKGSSGDANNCIFTVMINGEKHAYQTTPELYPAITAAVKPLCEIQMALLTKPAQLLRAGSTMSPSFIIRNFLRDTIFASVASKNGFVPIYDSIRGGYALLKNRERRGEFDAAGVISSNFYGDAEAVQKSLTEMAGGKSWQDLTSWEIVKALVSKPVAGLEWISNLIEASTRMGEFMRARDKGKSVEEAAYDAVEITLNFGRSGATGQQINRMVPFFNACIQGGDKLYRLFKADPKTTMLRIGTYIILPSIVLWAANHDEDWYKELDPAIKMNNWILPGGSIRIPKPQEAGVLFGSGFEAVLDAAAGQDQKAMGEWATTFLENMTPGVMPTLILPLIEWVSNYSFFRNKPVVSQSMQRLPDELQYGPYTSETSKFVGGIAGVSPAKLDNLWRGYTGTMGMFLIQAPDLWAADKQNLPAKKLSEMAFVRDFAINDMNLNRTMNDFYRLKEAAAKQHAGYGKKGKPTAEVAGVNVAAQSILKLQKEAREITASPKYNSVQKRALVDKLQAKQKKIAQFCIKKYGNKFDY